MLPDDKGHHIIFRKRIEGVTQVMTRISHNSPPIGDSLGLAMANQLCLRLKEFWELVDCPMSEADWDQLIRDRFRSSGGRNPFLRR